jgi:hypothetical protein
LPHNLKKKLIHGRKLNMDEEFDYLADAAGDDSEQPFAEAGL